MTHTAHRRPGGRGTAPRAALAALLLLALAALPAAAQDLLRGRVVRGGQGVAGAEVTLHRVTNDSAGPTGTTRSGADGAFTLPLPPPAGEGFTVYLATAEVDGVRYFGGPVHSRDSLARGYEITAYDTTSSRAVADSVRLARRDVIFAAERQGGWEVGEVLRIENRAGRTVVPENGRPVWGWPLPEGAFAFEVGESDVATAEVVQVGGRAWISAPLPPGAKQILVRYRLKAGEGNVVLPVGLPTDSLQVFVQQPAPGATVAGLTGPEAFAAQGTQYQQWRGGNLSPDAKVEVTWDVPSPPIVDPRIAAGVLTAVVLAVGLVAALRRRPPSPSPSSPDAGDAGGDAGRAEPAAAAADGPDAAP